MDVSRLYESQFPKVGDITICRIKSIDEVMGVYVELLEYGNIEGLILPNELSKRRYRSIHRIAKIGRIETVMVIKTDEAKRYIDLSKKRVLKSDIEPVQNRYNKSKKVILTARQVALKLNKTTDEINSQVMWPLARAYPHAYDALKLAITSPDEVFQHATCSRELFDEVVDMLRSKVAKLQIRVRARVCVSCSCIGGVNAVRDSLLSLLEFNEKQNPEQCKLKIQLIASPIYVLIVTSDNKPYAIQMMNQLIEQLKQKIESYEGGVFIHQGGLIISSNVDSEDESDLEDDASNDGADESSDSDSEQSYSDASSDSETK